MANNPYINNVAVHQFYEKYTKTYVNIYTDKEEGYIAFDPKSCKILSKHTNLQRCTKLARSSLTDNMTKSIKQYVKRKVIFKNRYNGYEWQLGTISQIFVDIIKKDSYKSNIKLEIKYKGKILNNIDPDDCFLAKPEDFVLLKKILKEKIRLEKLVSKIDLKIEILKSTDLEDVINSEMYGKKEE